MSSFDTLLPSVNNIVTGNQEWALTSAKSRLLANTTVSNADTDVTLTGFCAFFDVV